jgi:hypothetical protein
MPLGRRAANIGSSGFRLFEQQRNLVGTLVNVLEKSALRPGVRPICQATKLLDRDPIVRRMANRTF